jgi:hypothetical protein
MLLAAAPGAQAFTGWGQVVAPSGSSTVPAYYYSGSWVSYPLPNYDQVYIEPYGSSWDWAYSHTYGYWFAVPAAYVQVPHTTIFDFPTLRAGETFTIDPSSQAGGLPIHGQAKVLALSPTSAQLWVSGQALGLSAQANIQVQQYGPYSAWVSAQMPGGSWHTDYASIMSVGENYSEFAPPSNHPGSNVVLRMDGYGRFLVDYTARGGGAFHLVLDRAS